MEAKKQEKLYSVKLTHDYWPGHNHMDEATGLLHEERIKAGEIIEVPVEIALKLITEKKAERADELS